MDTPQQKPLSKTILRQQRAELRQRIVAEAEICGPLRGVALAMIDYAYSFGDLRDDVNAPYFEAKTEWILFPDPWLALKFTHQRKYAIHVSVGVRALRERPDLPTACGRFPSWTRFSLTSPQQLPTAMQYLEEAYYESESMYRDHHGKPKRGA